MKSIRELAHKYAPMLSEEDRRRGAGGYLPLAWQSVGRAKEIPADVVEMLQATGRSYPTIIRPGYVGGWTVPGVTAERIYAEREQADRRRRKYGSWWIPKGAGREHLR